MFLLNQAVKEGVGNTQRFTIQNVPIKLQEHQHQMD